MRWTFHSHVVTHERFNAKGNIQCAAASSRRRETREGMDGARVTDPQYQIQRGGRGSGGKPRSDYTAFPCKSELARTMWESVWGECVHEECSRIPIPPSVFGYPENKAEARRWYASAFNSLYYPRAANLGEA
ncbi:hypothetical protein Baya_9083 [Bagarius yarrelli]|uniref:Uncharacterized protein n=1 Tax=Bagarius yarrelli TaxID=175774 RepID=A0A556U7D0_BAGYA|nr:hypothetical protein Baya_9083 [Bagarius yarrelli]